MSAHHSLYMTDPAALRAKLRARDGDECFYCGREKPDTIEHLLNKRLARSYQRAAYSRTVAMADDPANLVLACEPCNKAVRKLTTIAAKVRHRERTRQRLAKEAA